MANFKINDIKELFESDLSSFIANTRIALQQLLAVDGSRSDLERSRVYAHSMKGVAAMVGALALSKWGNDLEELYDLAEAAWDRERPKAHEVAGYVMQSLEAWDEMGRLTIESRNAEANTIYERLRSEADKRWPGCLRNSEASAISARYVPFSGELQSFTPSLHAAAVAARIVLPALKPMQGVGCAADDPRPNSAMQAEDDELVQIFRDEAAGYFEELAIVVSKLLHGGAAEDSTWDTARRLCHTLKGSAAMVGLDEVAKKAKAAEKTAAGAVENPAVRSEKHVRKLRKCIEAIATLMGAAFEVKRGAQPQVSQVTQAVAALDAELADVFIRELREQVDVFEVGVLAWERDGGSEQNRGIVLRVCHTIKGAANSVGFVNLGEAIHETEGVLEQAGASAETPPEFFSALLGIGDLLRRFVDAQGARSPEWEAEMSRAIERLRNALIANADQCGGMPQRDGGTDFDPELLGAFAVDLKEQASLLESTILCWERGEDPAEQVQIAFRALHTLKGGANSLGMKALGASIHHLEGLLECLGKESVSNLPPKVFAFLFSVADALSSYGADLQQPGESKWTVTWDDKIGEILKLVSGSDVPIPVLEPMESGSELEAPLAPSDYVRVDASRVRRLLSQVGELVVERNRFGSKMERAVSLRHLLSANRQRLLQIVENFQEAFEFSNISRNRGNQRGDLRHVEVSMGPKEGVTEFSELEFDRYDEFNMMSRALTEVADDLGAVAGELERLIESFRSDEQRFAVNSKVMQGAITDLTTQTVDTLFRRLDRIFRDAVQAESKEATLQFGGLGTRLDRAIIERLYTPLLHLVRNAVAHGIETPEARERAGKPRRGAVTLQAAQMSNQVVISISDDGAGLSAEAVLARARDRKLVPAETKELSEAEVLDLIFTPGFSTASAISSVAGRGVGLDVVKQEIGSLNGSLKVETSEGVGTTWRVIVPLSLAVSEAVIIGVRGQEYAVPLNFVSHGLLVERDRILLREDGEFYEDRGALCRLIRLWKVFGLADGDEDSRGISVNVGDTRVVLLVDRVPARREIVVKNLDALLSKHPYFDGATLDSDGKPVLILNVPALVRAAASGKFGALKEPCDGSSSREIAHLDGEVPARKSEQFTVLVVDDSLSVRTVQERLLGELGCKVILANDGLDALERLRACSVDFVFTDLEMPRMNGYDLISTMRNNESWSKVPIVLVTSRAAQKHLNKAIQLGANAFLTKPFTQKDLIRVMETHAGYFARVIAAQ